MYHESFPNHRIISEYYILISSYSERTNYSHFIVVLKLKTDTFELMEMRYFHAKCSGGQLVIEGLNTHFVN